MIEEDKVHKRLDSDLLQRYRTEIAIGEECYKGDIQAYVHAPRHYIYTHTQYTTFTIKLM